jgi:hypothetical protein
MPALAAPAAVDAPKFHSASSSVSIAHACIVNLDEPGLGKTNIVHALGAAALYTRVDVEVDATITA